MVRWEAGSYVKHVNLGWRGTRQPVTAQSALMGLKARDDRVGGPAAVTAAGDGELRPLHSESALGCNQALCGAGIGTKARFVQWL